jgi:geranylgeranyl pyrophosphate synthase
LEHAHGADRETLASVYRKGTLDGDDVEKVLEVLEAVGAQDYAQQLAQEKAEAALEVVKGVTLPEWAREELEALAQFLVTRVS